VSLLVLVAVAAAVGLALILLVGRGQRVSPASPPLGATPEGPPDLSWVRALGADGLDRLLRRLFEEMGLEPGASEHDGGSVWFAATDPRPIRGGRVYVQGIASPPGGRVDGDEVRALADAARAEAAGKAVLVTLGAFSDDAREAAKDVPVELVDGDALAALVKKHLPQVHATRTV
jgi:restriction endonuclease Mrr